MPERICIRFRNFRSDNLKSKNDPADENLKSLGLSVIAFVLVVAGAAVEAQQPTRIPPIGYLTGASLSGQLARTDAFRQGLPEVGYVEGENIVIESRYADG